VGYFKNFEVDHYPKANIIVYADLLQLSWSAPQLKKTSALFVCSAAFNFFFYQVLQKTTATS